MCFYRALLPAAIAVAPYVLVVGYYVVAYDVQTVGSRRLDYVPELWAYMFPLTPTSIYRTSLLDLGLSGLGHRDFAKADMAGYLGVLVLPASLAGLFFWRREATVRFFALLLALFFVLSMGPKLLYQREVVYLAGLAVRLPFTLWERLPLLGAVVQPGRYLVVCYMMMGVGMACLAARWQSTHGVRRSLVPLVLLLVTCVDFAFRPYAYSLPAHPELSESEGRVLDPRLLSGQTMYYQTQHERELVGGYISRRPKLPLEEYRAVPGMDCVFFADPKASCAPDQVASALATLGVTDVLLDPGDQRAAVLARAGLRLRYEDSVTAVWSLAE